MKSSRAFPHDAPAAAGASWRPLLTGSERERALRLIRSLANDVLAGLGDSATGPSLSAGSAGAAVFFAELERAAAHEDARELARRALDNAATALAHRPVGASLYSGFTGVAWAAEVVGELVDDGEDVNEDIDDALPRALDRVDWQRAPYDLITGLVGLGVYALERWPRPAAAAALSRIVAELDRLARRDEHGAYWWTAPELLYPSRREQYPGGGVDLGVAHGIAAVIPFLARVQAAAAVDVGDLLTAAVDWLLAHAAVTEAGPTIPYYVADGVEPAPARLAWCYGDPGVAAALLLAAQEVEQPAWVEHALALARTATRRAPEETGVVDAGLCHGSAGLGHLFNRMYQATGAPFLRDAALIWFADTLDRLDAAGPGGANPGEGAQTAFNGRGVLEGSAGVALALLAATTSEEPVWDRMFLVSTRR